MTEWQSQSVTVIPVDAQGNPIVAQRRVILTDSGSMLGAAFDPVTGDYLYVNYNGQNVRAVRGFNRPPQDEPCECPQYEAGSDCESVTVRSATSCVCLAFANDAPCQPPFASTCP